MLGHGPGQPVLSGSAWDEVRLSDLLRSLPVSTVLWFCEYYLKHCCCSSNKKKVIRTVYVQVVQRKVWAELTSICYFDYGDVFSIYFVCQQIKERTRALEIFFFCYFALLLLLLVVIVLYSFGLFVMLCSQKILDSSCSTSAFYQYNKPQKLLCLSRKILRQT